MKGRTLALLAILIVIAAAVIAAFTVPITVGGKGGAAKLGSPDYTEALASRALPPVPPKFGGEIRPVQWDETFDVGSDTGTPVDDRDYKVLFKFTGKLAKLTLSLDRPKLTPADEQRLMKTAQRSSE